MDPRYTIQIQYEEGGEFIPRHNLLTIDDALFMLKLIMENGEYISIRVIDWKIDRTKAYNPPVF